MKSWTIDREIRQDPHAMAAIERANAILEASATESAYRVDARWSLDDRHRYVLTLTDWVSPEGVSATFDPHDLQSRAEMKWRLSGIWDDCFGSAAVC